ncbi:MAG: cupin domain-containing protein [Pseudomonadota bacterium]|nr:cupin domain-containing protein [Pseudomonadota bacterium]
MQTENLFDAIPESLDAEQFNEILSMPGVRIERIVSHGHTSPTEGWYDQDEHEWVMVLQGSAVLAFENSADVRLAAGDYLNIPAHCRHRVVSTDPDQKTVWLAVFYRAE